MLQSQYEIIYSKYLWFISIQNMNYHPLYSIILYQNVLKGAGNWLAWDTYFVLEYVMKSAGKWLAWDTYFVLEYVMKSAGNWVAWDTYFVLEYVMKSAGKWIAWDTYFVLEYVMKSAGNWLAWDILCVRICHEECWKLNTWYKDMSMLLTSSYGLIKKHL